MIVDFEYLKPREDRTLTGAAARGVNIFAMALLAIMALGTVACKDKQSGSQAQLGTGESVAIEQVPVETLKLQLRSYEESFFATGQVEAQDEVTVSAEFAGRITSIHFDVGDTVKAGELLISLDDASVQARIKQNNAQIDRSKAQLNAAFKDLDRAKELLATQAGDQKTLDNATRDVQTFESDVAAGKANLEAAQVDLAKTNILAPINGQISMKHVSFGEYMTPGARLYEIVQTDRIKFAFSLAERDVPRVHRGDELNFSVDAFPDEDFTAPIRTIAPAGNQNTRTFRVELTMANPGEEPLLPGMAGRVKVVRSRYENVYVLPEDAILRDEGQSYVYLTNNSHAKRADVTIISSVGANAVVASDFGTGYDCIILGQYAIEEGTALNVRRTHEEIPKLVFD